MLWFLTDPGRLERERAAVDTLQADIEWLRNVHWRIDDADVVMDCDICIGADQSYTLNTRFPEHYPSAPPSVRPKEPTVLSSHQFGSGGELCLEIGPDNWHRDQHSVTDLLRSAHRLLHDEAARENEPDIAIPSRHELTEGQSLRGKFARFVLTPSAKVALETLEDHWVIAHFIVVFHNKTWTVFLAKLEGSSSQQWVCNELPNELARFGHSALGVARNGPKNVFFNAILTSGELLDPHLASKDLPTPNDEDAPIAADRVRYLLTRTDGANWKLIMRWPGEKEITTCATIDADGAPPSERLGPEAELLAEKKVAIVGLGSAGSKLATSLARAGVRSFVLIDDDILHPANLVRHDSDWLYVGQHKVDAVAERLALINPAIKIQRHRVRLVGQESATTAAGAISSLGHADLIVDATANPDVFNLCAHVARESKRALLWLEVFGGGFGGLIARARPEKDAEPFTLRQAILDVADRLSAEKGVDVPKTAADYSAIHNDGPPLVASDSDVAVLAHLAAQLVLDTLIGREPSHYPHPAYFVGLSREWIFDQPLHVFPVDADSMGSWSRDANENDVERQAGFAFLQSLFEEHKARAND